jgi:hypothetical protein
MTKNGKIDCDSFLRIISCPKKHTAHSGKVAQVTHNSSYTKACRLTKPGKLYLYISC